MLMFHVHVLGSSVQKQPLQQLRQLQQLHAMTSSSGLQQQQQLGGEVKEYCERESFEANCSPADEVIVIRSAIYGRMNLGQCVQEAYDNLGDFQEQLSTVF